jgi:hypothetical protein
VIKSTISTNKINLKEFILIKTLLSLQALKFIPHLAK